MLVLGLLLIIVAALITTGAITDAGETATVEIVNQTITTTAAGVFVAGAATMLVFLVGVWILTSSFGRARRRRVERKAAKRDQKESLARLEEERAALREENDRLAQELADRRSAAGGAAAAGPTSGAATAAGPKSGAATGRPTQDEPTLRTDSPTDSPTDASTDTRRTETDTRDDSRIIDHRTDLTERDRTNSSSPRHSL